MMFLDLGGPKERRPAEGKVSVCDFRDPNVNMASQSLSVLHHCSLQMLLPIWSGQAVTSERRI